MSQFDQYAKDYQGGMEHPFKKMVGTGLDDFIRLKAQWLLKNFKFQSTTRLLDYGCGDAIFLRNLRLLSFPGQLFGCDLSPEMLSEARRKEADFESTQKIQLDSIFQNRAPYPDHTFDWVVISGVIHHVPDSERPLVFAEIKRLLKPGGHVVVFEHNPFNPVTQWVVRNTEIDHDARLISTYGVSRLMSKIGFQEILRKYILFFPPKLKTFQKLEHYLGWLPLGGQYALVATLSLGEFTSNAL